MQFIRNGPDIPDRLLQEHEDGRVVFFYGAGISYPAGLPGFSGLVEAVYDSLGEPPSPIEQTAIAKDQYDTVIGLLEDRIVGRRSKVRGYIASILIPDLSRRNATTTHEALLTLARARQGRYRVVTTNFDRLFEQVISDRKLSVQSYEAPLLPVPKNRMDGLIYLHGLLSKNPTASDLDRLVVSSGDFGLAYLSERWAARFVSELLRNYTVCFVGYSLTDPVLRYMMDALAADRLLGESPIQAYAFGSYRKGKKEVAFNEWKAKNVTPILYPDYRRHYYLHRTLHEWASTYRDGVSGKESLIVRHATTPPMRSTRQDDYVGRVLWALVDRSGIPAKRFAEMVPVPPLEWLEPLAERRFKHDDLPRFGVPPLSDKDEHLIYSLTARPTPYGLAPWMALVTASHFVASNWDPVMTHVAHWLTRHLHDPKLLLWVATRGGELHPYFASMISREIEANPPSAAMQTLWRVVLTGRLQGRSGSLELYGWRDRFQRVGMTPTLRLELRDLLSPRVRLSQPFSLLKRANENATVQTPEIKDLVNWEIVLVTEHAHVALEEIKQDTLAREALPELLSEITNLLHDTLDLMAELGGANAHSDLSSVHQPSISPHPQNRDFHDWTALIDLARDAWLATVEKFPKRAWLEAERWFQIQYPLFRRLVFFAATHFDVIPPGQAIDWLLTDDRRWLWSTETRRECFRLLAAITPCLDDQQLERLERAILQGPPRELYKEDLEPERLQQISDHEIWLRLAKCQQGGAQLGTDAAARLEALSTQHPRWQVAEDERDEFPMWLGDGDEWRTFVATPKRRRELVAWLREHPDLDFLQEDDWQQRCRQDFPRAASALLDLARRGEWPVTRWREALQAWADEKLLRRSWRYVGPVLSQAPNEIIQSLAHTLSFWLEFLAKTFEDHEAAFFNLIRRILSVDYEGPVRMDDPVGTAINHPVGHATEAALRWWYRRSLEDGQGLPNEIKALFTEVCNTQVEKFRHGRVLLAAHVIALFRVDRDWAVQYLLPLFDWQRSAFEARTAWEGFLWSPRFYRPLMEAFKRPFFETARHYAELGRHDRQYAAFLTVASLERGDTFSKSEMAAATRSLPIEGLQYAAQTLVQVLESAGEQRAESWRNRIKPYIHDIWPKSQQGRTASIAEQFARLCVTTSQAFPEACSHGFSRSSTPI
jgi:SIR2-like domain